MRVPLHQGRLAPWTADELRAQLSAIIDGLIAEHGEATPLAVAAELLGGELDAFVLFGRLGHLDPPREDGQVPIAVVQCMSTDPQIDAKIRATAKKWASSD